MELLNGKKFSSEKFFFRGRKKINYGLLNGRNFFPGPKFFWPRRKKLVWRFEWEEIFPRAKNFSAEEKKINNGLLNGKKFFAREKNFTMDLLNGKNFFIQKSILNFFRRKPKLDYRPGPPGELFSGPTICFGPRRIYWKWSRLNPMTLRWSNRFAESLWRWCRAHHLKPLSAADRNDPRRETYGLVRFFLLYDLDLVARARDFFPGSCFWAALKIAPF
jgi:hypothetical protein